MAIILHGAPLSPYVRKVRVLLAEKSLEYKLEVVLPYAQPEGYDKLNPLGRIPALEDDDITLADSAIICHYLEQTHPTPSLIPSAPADRAQCEWLEKYADYELSQATTASIFRESLIVPLMKKEPDQARINNALDNQLPPLLDYLEKQLGTNEWFVNNQFSLADISIACQLINMEHAGHFLDGKRWPAMQRFLQRSYDRDSFSLIKQERKQIEKIRGLI
ncbi:MAG: glutathione S-transferase family protein [Pontibacterium sp.]